jgi:lipopolysaccharide biosynthesis glycosyltransferase
MATEGGSLSAKRVAAKIGRRTPGVRRVLALRDENRRLAKAQRDLREKRDALRGRLTAMRQDLRAARSERNAACRQLERMIDAVDWLSETPRPDRPRGEVALRARIAAAAFVEALTRGEDPSAALVGYAHSLTELPAYPYRYRLPALASVLGRFSEFRLGIHAALVVHGYHTNHLGLARHHLELAGEAAVRLIPVEFARIQLADNLAAADEVFDTVLRLASPAPTQWLDVLSAISASHDLVALARATDALSAQASTWDEDDRRTFDGFVEYGARSAGTRPSRSADVRFGVMGYRRADLRRSSRNLGDYIQTISALGHVLRRSGLRLTGETDLVESAKVLGARIRPDLVIDGEDATVELVEVSRDDSALDDIPVGTWYIAFGWHLHANILGAHGLPYHPHLRPIFVSFHLNRRDMLSDDAVEYLRRYGPIGCRDWYTVDLLTYLGVPAFFTGCLTTTVDAYFENHVVDENLPAGFVDARPQGGGELVRQGYREMRGRSLAENLRAALATLDDYRTRFSTITTGRLHCYLPATSIGIPTIFVPKRTFDVRFEGLTDDGADLDAIRMRLRNALLEPVLTSIFAGDPEEEVYALWRSITEPMAAADVISRATAYEWPATTLDIPRAIAAIKQGSWSRPVPSPESTKVVDLCVCLDQNYLTQLYTVLDRCLERTDRPIRLWALVRGMDTDDFERFAVAFPEVDVTFLPCDAIDYGDVFVNSKRITVSTMDRLLLPDLLDGITKAVNLDLDLLPRADIGHLHDIVVDEATVAARPSHLSKAIGGVTSFAGVAHSHFPDSREGWRLLNLVHRHAHADDTGFYAGVIVMNLQRMREDDFLRQYAGFAEHFGLNDQYILNLYAGDSFLHLDRRWNGLADRDVLDDDFAIVHWVGPLKPWGDIGVPHQDEWRVAVSTMMERRGGPGQTAVTGLPGSHRASLLT